MLRRADQARYHYVAAHQSGRAGPERPPRSAPDYRLMCRRSW